MLDPTSLYARRIDQLFFQQPQSHRIGNLDLQLVHVNPHIYIIDDFLSPADLEYWHGRIDKGGFGRSYVDTDAGTVEDDSRTSSFLAIPKRDSRKVADLEQRAAALLGCYSSSSSVEALQLVRYRVGQYFNVHHDLADYEEGAALILPPKSPYCPRRLVTIFCYLNQVHEGGETEFEACRDENGQVLAIEPRPGRAVVFGNITQDGQPDARTVHAGRPVAKGIKYGLNIWLTEEM